MEEWNRLSNLLLEKNHIKLPMEKRFFLSFLEDDTDSIKISKVLKKFETMGFLKDDQRLTTIRSNLKALISSNAIKYEEFKDCIENHICIISKILTQDLIIPNFDTFTRKMKTIYEETKQDNEGNVASYIPQLKRVNPDQYGLSVCTIDGQRYNLGDTKVDFTVQSCCKPINYGIALEALGEEEVHK